jgi:hypothetical protein
MHGKSSAKETLNDRNFKQKQQLALQLRCAGHTLDTIAEKCGWGNKSSASRAIKDALSHFNDAPVAELRALENMRLDGLLRTFLPKALGGNMGAAALCLRISEQRCKLNGLNAEIATTPEVRTVIREVPFSYLGIDAPPAESHESEQKNQP